MVQGRALAVAIEAGDLVEQPCQDQHGALALEPEQARYQAALAARRYEAVDPDNCPVAAELEGGKTEGLLTSCLRGPFAARSVGGNARCT